MLNVDLRYRVLRLARRILYNPSHDLVVDFGMTELSLQEIAEDELRSSADANGHQDSKNVFLSHRSTKSGPGNARNYSRAGERVAQKALPTSLPIVQPVRTRGSGPGPA